MAERTEHGWQRHQQGDRPTREAFTDRQNPREIYHDIETHNTIYVGSNGRTHVFTSDGKHHTSYTTSRRTRRRKVHAGKWVRLRETE